MQRPLIASILVCAGCAGADPPAGLDCPGAIRVVTDAAELVSALAASSAGDCVLLESGDYSGPFTMATAGVKLAGAADASATLTSSADLTTLTVSAADVEVVHLSIRGPMSTGLSITEGGARIGDVEIADARRAAVEIRCEEQGCLMPTARVLFTNVSLLRSNSGALSFGAKVRFEGGRIAENTSSSVTGGAGLYALLGTDLELVGTTIEDNAYGLVIDGASTSARLEGAVVLRNAERGLWAQGLRGTMAAPSLSIGSGSRFEGNGLVAVGIVDARGVTIRDSDLVDTINKTVPIDVVQTADIGDGLGIFGGSAEIDVDQTELSGNARAQSVVDSAGPDIRFGANQIAGALKLVVQGAVGSTVVAPATDLSTTPMPLPIVANPLALP